MDTDMMERLSKATPFLHEFQWAFDYGSSVELKESFINLFLPQHLHLRKLRLDGYARYGDIGQSDVFWTCPYVCQDILRSFEDANHASSLNHIMCVNEVCNR
ncbi:hypothetical protein MMC14_007289, partial [Varicellaria rhodocarpa]|nr:hypothetical protein [Varicellaria rhodocarpa]